MPDRWYPNATIMPGAAAGYKKGRTSMDTVVAHFTVGRDSTQIGLNGYFHWLVCRNGEVVQFAEVDALTWHVGSWNGYGPGIEVEYLPGVDDAVFTDEARVACGSLVRWLGSEWGFPLDYYDGDRIPPVWRGFIAHRSVQGGDHTDFWPRDDWDRMVADSPKGKKRMNPILFSDKNGKVWVYDPNAHTKTWVKGPDALNDIAALWAINGVDATIHTNLQNMVADAVEIKEQTGTVGGAPALTVEQTAAINAGVLSGELLSEAFPR